ncbi:MAG TPA: hypothetical protein VF574_08685 [Allosphingosinicella sp.]
MLSDVLSIDAWHEPFRVDGSTSAVHVELSFTEGRIGGSDVDFPFTFKVSLKRALLTVRAERPLEIDRRSIARSVPEAEIELTKLRTARETAEASLSGKATLTPALFGAVLTGATARGEQLTQQDILKIVQNVPEVLVSPRPRNPQEYAWELVPTYRDGLRGQPWDPIDAPRLRVKPSTSVLPQLLPTISVGVSCALEDLHISDIVPKRLGLNEKLRKLIHNDINEAAAIQHLKLVLREADLEPRAFDNRFAEVILASVLAVPE